MKTIIKRLYRPVIAALCAALLLPVFAGCSLTVKPRESAADTPVSEVPGSDFTFTGKKRVAQYYDPGLPDALKTVEITADRVSGAFTVRTAASIGADELKGYLNVSPVFAFDISRGDDTTYTLTPSEPLDEDAVYRFTVGDASRPQHSFVFQTDSALVIKSVLPADRALMVPVNSGIEVHFSEPLRRDIDIKEYFYITPETGGEYMTYPDGRTVVFVPKEPLAVNTIYTIHVSAGLPSSSGKTLAEDFTAVFRTSSETADENGDLMISLETYEPQFTTDETPVIRYYYYSYGYRGENTPPLSDTKVDIWRYRSADDIMAAMKGYESVRTDYLYTGGYIFPSDGLEEVGSYEIKNETSADRQNQGYLILPDVGEGAYLLNITFHAEGGESEYFRQAIMQVSDLIVYTESSDEQLLVWVNDASADAAVPGASVTAEFFGADNYWNIIPWGEKPDYISQIGESDGDGIVMLDSGGRSGTFMIVEKDGHSLFLCVSSFTYYNSGGWFSHVFTDRETYFSNDMVNYWGIVAPSYGGVLPGSLYLKLGNSPTAQKIAVLPDGSFSGSYAVEDSAAWGIHMNFTDGDGNTVTSKYVSITQQSKPLYRATLTFDKLFYSFGDTVKLTLDTSFYDGTPAPGLEFTLYGNYFLQDGTTVKTGPDGSAVYEYKTAPYKFNTTYPLQLSARASLIGNEDGELYVSAYVPYLQSAAWLREKRITPDEGDGYTELYLNYFDTSALRASEDLEYPLYPENTVGKAAPGSVKVRLIEYAYIREYVRTDYDPVTKTSHKVYNNRTEERDIKKFTASFEDGVIRLDHVKRTEDFSGYHMYEVTYYDENNRQNCVLHVYADAGEEYYYRYDDYYELKSDADAYAVGDTVNTILHFGGKPVESGRVLFTVYSDGLDLREASGEGAFSFIFEDKDAAGLAVLASHFDGRRTHAAGYLPVRYNYAENNTLTTVITPDKTEYRPGERAKVTVHVTDADDNPVTGGQITLSMVDEACFALGEQTRDPLRTYYEGGGVVIPYIARDDRFFCLDRAGGFLEYNSKDGGMAEEAMAAPQTARDDSAAVMGGMGGAAVDEITVREVFLDNPLFETYAVSENGKAEIELTVPDNVTEWRFTAVAAYHPDRSKISGMYMGTSKTGVICTLPFFVDVTLGDTYIEGDDIAGHARVYGSELENGAEVSYIVRLTDDSDAQTAVLTLTAKAGEFARFNFGEYTGGSYNITVEATSGLLSDGVKLPFEIISGGIMVDIRREIATSDIGNLNALMYPVFLTFTDAAYDSFFSLCRSLMRGSSRSDAMAAYYAAALVSETMTGSRSYIDSQLNGIKAILSGYSGFIPLLAYSEGDVALTAKICAIVPEALASSKKAELAGLFEDYIEKRLYADDAEMCAAYLGLAALGRPVLGDLYYAAENSGTFGIEARLYLAAALAYIGDWDAAAEYYQYIKDADIDSGGDTMYVRAANTEESIRLTALALLTASVVDTDGAQLMAGYLSTHTSTVNIYDLELASYVRRFVPAEAEEASFAYSVGDTAEEITLKPGEYHSLALDRRDFAAFDLISADDSVIVYASYRGSAEEACDSGELSDEIQIEKSIEPFDTARGLYKVTLTYSAVTDRNYAFYTISDRVPSGARYFAPSGGESIDLRDFHTFAFISNSGSQAMDGYMGLFNYTEKAITGLSRRTVRGSVSYLIRAASEGSFVVEGAVLRDTSTGAYAVSDRATVVIDNSGWKIE
ncbi:MAG: Ig-like domain-containing protein [Eubacteriales bacterium]|nr:Ig-like domain-containing protein [Eubacteriales bacterium]